MPPKTTLPQVCGRILEEWKVNVDLHKFHDDLKQRRLNHVLTIQTALLVFFGYSIREAMTPPTNKYLLGTSLIVALFAFVVSLLGKSMDRRARAYVDVVKTRLLLLEAAWNDLNPKNRLLTYSHQWEILVHKSDKTINEYLSIRRLGNQDKLRSYCHETAAHVKEELLILILSIFWSLLAVGAIVLLIK